MKDKEALARRREERLKKSARDCKFCGESFTNLDKKRQFCSLLCACKGNGGTNQYAAKKGWLECSMCLGRVGYGVKNTSKLLSSTSPGATIKVSFKTIWKAWKEQGFSATLPKAGNWGAENGLVHNAGSRMGARERVDALFESGKWMELVMLDYRKEARRVKSPDTARVAYYLRTWAYLRYLDRNPVMRVKHNIRTRTSAKIRHLAGGIRRGGRVAMFGCSSRELKEHFESMFDRRMTWGNYGTYWEVDHVTPLSRFDLSNKRERSTANHFTNLRPLEVSENRKRGADRSTAHQPTLCL